MKDKFSGKKISGQPGIDYLDSLLRIAVEKFKGQDLQGSLCCLDEILATNSSYPFSYLANFYKGRILQKMGDDSAAEKFYRASIQLSSEYPVVHNNLANILKKAGKLSEAKKHYRLAIKLKPDYFEAYFNLSGLYVDLKKIDLAKKMLEKVFEIKPNYEPAREFYESLMVPDKKINDLEKELDGDPNNGELCYRLALKYMDNQEYGKAEVYFARALENKYTQNSELFNRYGLLLFGLKRPAEEAAKIFYRGIAIHPEDYSLYNNLGHCLMRYGQLDKAIELLEKAIAIDPNQAMPYYCLGFVYLTAAEYELAMEQEKKCIEHDSDNLPAFSLLLNSAQHLADWDTFNQYFPALLASVKALIKSKKNFSLDAFATIMMPFSNEQHAFIVKSQHGKGDDKQKRYNNYNIDLSAKKKLRIAYMSPDFTRNHPVGLLVNRIFSLHNSSEFETFGYGLREFTDPSAKVIEESFDHFASFAYVDDQEAAKKIHDDGIDILVDLAGHTKECRKGVLSQKPAPIQIQYLGYTASMQCDYIQYHITCEEVVPQNLQKYFSEKLIYMPEGNYSTFLQDVKNGQLQRQDYGLPENDVVFCCFNTVQRINEELFTVWMNILKAVPDSVLWMYKENETMKNNLCRFAKSQGIDDHRIHFFKYSLLTDHWHHQLADLWLDTFTLSGGTGSILCANAGLPVLTLAGNSPQSRIGAGVAAASCSEEMICYSLKEYQEKAIELGRHPEKLKAMKAALISRRESMPLFKPDRFIRHLEMAYETVWENYLSNKDPKTISIKKLS